MEAWQGGLATRFTVVDTEALRAVRPARGAAKKSMSHPHRVIPPQVDVAKSDVSGSIGCGSSSSTAAAAAAAAAMTAAAAAGSSSSKCI